MPWGAREERPLLKSFIVLLLAAVTCLCGCASGPVSEGNWSYFPPGPFVPLKQVTEPDVEVDKDACARETGDSRTPGFWLGYSRAFMDCMKARGWRRVSNPA